MHNMLLIHNNNVPSLQAFPQRIRFKMHSSDIDEYITNEIIPEIKTQQFDCICIKDTLSSNYLELYGLRLAYHIRLSQELQDKRFVPIIILSDLDSYLLNKITPMSNILFTKNIFIIKNSIDAIKSIAANTLPYLSVQEYEKTFLSRILIESPKDYLTHHSITNEWSIYQWSNLLEISSDAIKKNSDKISSMLYFKYLIAKYQLQIKTKNKTKQTDKQGRVLLIDDKWNDGWNDILKSFVSQQYTDVQLSVMEYDFKDKTIEDIKKAVQIKINDSQPDVVLLDLRLLESDNTLKINKKKSINKLSGIQIISEIKKINPGIQIIMFTASGDSLILDELHNKGILGYVKKDAPTDKYETSKNSFKKLDTLLKKGIDKNYLKKIWKLESDILKQSFLQNTNKLLSENQQVIFELRKNIQFIFEILNSNVPNPFVYAMLAIFKSIELLNAYYIEENWMKNKKYSFWRGSNSKIQTLDYGTLRDTKDGDYNLSSENKIMAIIKEKTSIREDTIVNVIKQLICSRNYAMHPSEKDSCKDFLIKEPKAEHIVNWFDMLYDIFKSLQEDKS